ncbi:uncharacterized protein ARMOST_08163 [Armillaria ostoyae]|uniref:Uncharacterized protein n=1 Tax=Armillaria ostoyae TaxID=47428 RepID=A0A284R7X2_ARMOS|nr:uncharacterized protein ARMOST_08163 [Armillaria ostoyae]
MDDVGRLRRGQVGLLCRARVVNVKKHRLNYWLMNEILRMDEDLICTTHPPPSFAMTSFFASPSLYEQRSRVAVNNCSSPARRSSACMVYIKGASCSVSLSQKGRRRREGSDEGFPKSGSTLKLSLEHPDGSLARPAFTNASSRYQASAPPSQIASTQDYHHADARTRMDRAPSTSPPSPMSHDRRIQRIHPPFSTYPFPTKSKPITAFKIPACLAYMAHFLTPVLSQGNRTVYVPPMEYINSKDFCILVRPRTYLSVAIDARIVIPKPKTEVAASLWLVVFSAGVGVPYTPNSVVVAIIVECRGSGLHTVHAPARSHLTSLLSTFHDFALHPYAILALKLALLTVVTAIVGIELRFGFRRLTPPDNIRLSIL